MQFKDTIAPKNFKKLLIFKRIVCVIGFGIATTGALLQIVEILSRRKQEERKSCNQDFKGSMDYELWANGITARTLPGFRCYLPGFLVLWP